MAEQMNAGATSEGADHSPPHPNTIRSKGISRIISYSAEVGLRVFAIAFTLAGAITMATSHQTVMFFGIVMVASYNYSSSFRFKVVADSLACGLSVLSLVIAISLNSPKSSHKNYFYLLLHDVVSVCLVLSGCSAATAIGMVGRFGMDQTGWIAICDRVPKFCDKIIVSIASSFVALTCLLVLVVMSAHKLRSREAII